ncbi:hypothetical protein GCM10020331_089930 [Ectobacillus funiculus]
MGGSWTRPKGIEVKHPLYNEEHEMRARELAERYGLVQTGSSDFHGFYGDSGAQLGSKKHRYGSF